MSDLPELPQTTIIPSGSSEWLVWLNGVWRSWTVWFMSAVTAWPLYSDSLHSLLVPSVMSEDVWKAYIFKWAALIVGLVGLALRVRTTQSISAKGTTS